ncbi:MAG: hypothetical protein LBF78_10485 [Treponema sp.]|nr:hypothetical protein [Treponema sp.]
MKKRLTLCLLVITAVSRASFAQEFNFSGEIKTGVYWESRKTGDADPKQLMELGNTDDAGGFSPATGFTGIPGRFRLNLEFKPVSTIGFKVRFEDSTFTGRTVAWSYSYAYGNFLEDQLKISAGKLGDSPWATGGPELNTSVDESFGNSFAGVRTEYKPFFAPGLDAGFSLNPVSHMVDRTRYDVDFGMFMRETVLGIGYTHELFVVRFAWRLDGPDKDNVQGEDGHTMVYRVEEKILKNHVPGLSVWANGRNTGLVNGDGSYKNYTNWLYIGFEEYGFNAQLRTGLEVANLQKGEYYKKLLTIKPLVFYSITPMISAGFTFTFAKDFGALSQVDYDNMTIEPQVKVTFNPNAYAAFVYGFQQLPRIGAVETANYINLRLVYSL